MDKNKLIKLLYLTITFLITTSLIIRIIKLNLIPIKFIILITIFILTINLVTILLIKNKKIKLTGFITCIIIIIICIIGTSYIKKTDNYLDASFSNNQIEINTYTIITLKNKYQNTKELNDKKIGYYLNENQDKVIKNINKMINPLLLKYNDLFELYNDLINNKLDAIIIDENYLDIIKEENNNLQNLISILYMFDITKEIKIKKNNQAELKPINVFISGSDSRDQEIHNKSRSDVNIILTINPNKRKILITSIPRDYYVQIHNQKGLNDKLTHSGIYGIETSTKTIEDLLDIDIDYSIKINFNAVITLVDLIGGVDIYSDITFTPHENRNMTIKKGENHLNGEQTLAFARERYAYKTGDLHRMQNQQHVITSVFKKIMTSKSLLLKYDELLKSLTNLYYGDIPRNVISLYIKNQLNNLTSWEFSTYNLTGQGAKKPTFTSPKLNHYVMIPDEKNIKEANRQIIDMLN